MILQTCHINCPDYERAYDQHSFQHLKLGIKFIGHLGNIARMKIPDAGKPAAHACRLPRENEKVWVLDYSVCPSGGDNPAPPGSSGVP
jgi:hypothetical protein